VGVESTNEPKFRLLVRSLKNYTFLE